MNHSLLGVLREIFGDDRIEEAYLHTGSVPVSIAALRNHCIHTRIDEMIAEKKSNRYIARKVKRCEKTIARRRKALFEKSKTKPPPKK